MPHPTDITYVFHLGGGASETIRLDFDAKTYRLKAGQSAEEPAWTRLETHQCAQCPLDPKTSPFCPFARALSPFVARFDRFYSYDTSVVEVRAGRRTIVTEGPLQQGMASLLGLIGATSGCPKLAFFRPMARHHLPFASAEETLTRAFATHLLREYLRQGGTGSQSIDVGGLQAHYAAVALVNRGMADRIRSAFVKDSVVNAIVILDTFAQAIPFVVEESLEEIRPLFDLD